MKSKPKLPKKKPVQIERVRSTEITLEQWQNSVDLVSEWQKLAKTPIFELGVACLKNGSPAHDVLPALGVQPTDRIVHQSKIEGFGIALNSLEALGVFAPAETSPLTADFGAPDQNEIATEGE